MIAVRSMTIVLALLTAAPAARAEEVKGDLAGLQGTWSAAAGSKKKITVTMEIRGRAATVLIKTPVGKPIRARGEIRLDAATSPKSLDWVGFSGLDGQPLPEILGIYDLAGNTFRICTGGPDNPRPTAFEPGEGMLADVVTFTRQASSARPGAPSDDNVASHDDRPRGH